MLNTIRGLADYYKRAATAKGADGYPVLQAYLMGYADGLLSAERWMTENATGEILATAIGCDTLKYDSTNKGGK